MVKLDTTWIADSHGHMQKYVRDPRAPGAVYHKQTPELMQEIVEYLMVKEDAEGRSLHDWVAGQGLSVYNDGAVTRVSGARKYRCTSREMPSRW